MNWKKLLFWRKNKTVSMKMKSANEFPSGITTCTSSSFSIIPVMPYTIEFSTLMTDEMNNYISDEFLKPLEVSMSMNEDKITIESTYVNDSEYDKGFKAGQRYEAMERFNKPEEN